MAKAQARKIRVGAGDETRYQGRKEEEEEAEDI